jgi:hypothetical protein
MHERREKKKDHALGKRGVINKIDLTISNILEKLGFQNKKNSFMIKHGNLLSGILVVVHDVVLSLARD